MNRDPLEEGQDNSQLALALCRALMICLVRLDERFSEELSDSLAEVASMLKDENGPCAHEVASNLVMFSHTLHSEGCARRHTLC